MTTPDPDVETVLADEAIVRVALLLGADAYVPPEPHEAVYVFTDADAALSRIVAQRDALAARVEELEAQVYAVHERDNEWFWMMLGVARNANERAWEKAYARAAQLREAREENARLREAFASHIERLRALNDAADALSGPTPEEDGS